MYHRQRISTATVMLILIIVVGFVSEPSIAVAGGMDATRQEKLNDTTPISKLSDTDAMIQLAMETIIARKDFFREYLNREESTSALNVDDSVLVDDLVWLDNCRHADRSIDTKGNIYRIRELLKFNYLLAYEANKRIPISDEQLFIVYLRFYLSTTPFAIGAARAAWPYFSKRLLQKYADAILKPYIDGKYPCDELCCLAFDAEFFSHYHSSFFRKRIDENNVKMRNVVNDNAMLFLHELKENACFGDPDARKHLLQMFAQCQVAEQTYGDLESLLYCLVAVCHNDVAIALLKRFNDVRLDNDDGGCYGILAETVFDTFIRWYPDDEFVLKWHGRIKYFHDGKHTGKDEETKQFFSELKKWVKEKFNFDLVLPPERMSFVKYEQLIYAD